MAVLSGLLTWQENMVASFYRPQGLIFRGVRRQHVWSAVTLERPRREA
jgi:ribosomal protein L11 methyltransferase